MLNKSKLFLMMALTFLGMVSWAMIDENGAGLIQMFGLIASTAGITMLFVTTKD